MREQMERLLHDSRKARLDDARLLEKQIVEMLEVIRVVRITLTELGQIARELVADPKSVGKPFGISRWLRDDFAVVVLRGGSERRCFVEVRHSLAREPRCTPRRAPLFSSGKGAPSTQA